MSAPTRIDEHQQAVRDLIARIAPPDLAPVETVDLLDATGRRLAADVRSPIAIPARDNSAMDGFAISTDSTRSTADGQPLTLKLGPLIPAGHEPGVLDPHTARAIMTGAAIPEGCDAIVPVEETDLGRFAQIAALRPEDTGADGGLNDHRTGDASGIGAEAITITLGPQHREVGRFIRRAGSDTEAGDVAARAGTVLTPRLIGHLASVGLQSVEVTERLRAVVVSTGAELGEDAGQVRDANGPALVTALREMGVDAVRCVRVGDDPRALIDTVTMALRETGAQLIVSSGGVSAGAVEPIRQAARLEGSPLRLAFHTVAMQPGGPQGLGVFTRSSGEEVAWIALPGNPVSALVSLEMFVRQAVGASARPRVRLEVRTQTGEDEASPPGRTQIRRGRIQTDSTVRLVGGPGSHLLGALALADALVIIPADTTTIHDRDSFEVMVLT